MVEPTLQTPPETVQWMASSMASTASPSAAMNGEYQDFEPWLDAQSPHGEERDDYQGGDERHRDHPERWRHADHAKRAEPEDRHRRDDDAQRPEAHVHEVGEFGPGWQRAVPDHMRDHICNKDGQQRAGR